ncbi:MAG: hypothetical protein JG782_444 [Anaerophaga sp.]|nr:hypothetical protein [Anaerophaga sp.]MDN5291808.1 hypothetical protein [Anaerophaga sp.]
MKFLPIFDRVLEPQSIIDLVYNDVLGAVYESYLTQTNRFFIGLQSREKDEVKMFLKEKKSNVLSILDNSPFLELTPLNNYIEYDVNVKITDYYRLLLENHLNVMFAKFGMIKASQCDLMFSRSMERNGIYIDTEKKQIIVPDGFSFMEIDRFFDFAQYLVNSYLFEFYKTNLSIYENLTNSITGRDFAVLFHFKNDCDEVIRNLCEYQNGNASTKRTIENTISKHIDVIQKRFKHLETNGLQNEVLPFLTDFKKSLEYYPDAKEWNNIKSLIDLSRDLKEKPKTSSGYMGTFTGFHSKLKPHQIEKLYIELTDKNFMEASPEDFEALLTGKPLQGVKIKWIDISTTKPQKANLKTVFELFLLLNEKECFKENVVKETYLGKMKINKIIEDCFFDGIQDGKFKNVHKGNETNKPLQRTERQKELQAIISSL